MRSQKTEKRTSDALGLVEELTGKSKEMADLVEQEQANLDVAREIYDLRIKAKLSQTELARKVGTTQSVISRLEDADYDGHSLAMLRRIASALEKRVEIRFVPSPKLKQALSACLKTQAGEGERPREPKFHWEGGEVRACGDARPPELAFSNRL